MFKLIKKHEKKVLAVFGIGLMISFVASSGYGHGDHRSDPVVAHVNGTPVYASESNTARNEWAAITRSVVYPVQNYAGEETGQFQPYVVRLLGRQLVQEIEQHPDLFMLLRREARDAGARISNDNLEAIMANYYHGPQDEDDQTHVYARDGITDVLLIQNNFNRMADVIKVSQPTRDQFLAKTLQNLQLNLVEIPATNFVAKTIAPTPQQVQDQFKAYAGIAPGSPDGATNPFGFGYRYPDAVKVQYLTINHDAVQSVIDLSKTPYDWDVAARLYYRQHKDEFAATPPSSPTTQSSTQPASTVKPYADAAKDAMSKVKQPLVDKLLLDVENRLVTAMQSDYRTYSDKAVAGATTAPAAGPGYPSYSYLKQLTDQVQAATGVKVFVTDQTADYLSETDLAALPGIGSASDNPFSQQAVGFAAAALQKAQPYFTATDKSDPTLKTRLLQPGSPLQDYSSNVYIFRMVDARAAQAAPSVEAVAGKIDKDLRLKAGYDLAKAAAQPLLAAANTGALTAAADVAHLPVVKTEAFNAESRYLGANLTLSDAGRVPFLNQAFGLLSQYNPVTQPHPASVIELPQDGKLYVAQLLTVTPTWDPANLYHQTLQLTTDIRNQMQMIMLNQWFNYDAVVQRLGFKSDAASSS